MADEDIRIEKRSHFRAVARRRQVLALIAGQAVPFLSGEILTLPARSRKSSTFARTARPSRTRNSTRSPSLRPSASRTDFGSVICPLEVKVAGTSIKPPYYLPPVRIARSWRRLRRGRLPIGASAPHHVA